jgi:prophage regulatory protein
MNHNHQQQPKHTIEPYVTVKDLCKIVGRSYSTIRRWYKQDKTLPEPDQINGLTLGWKQSVIEEWRENIHKRNNVTY